MQSLVIKTLLFLAFAQVGGKGGFGGKAGGLGGMSSGFPNIALGVHAAADNGVTSSTTLAVSLGTPTAGSAIVCAYSEGITGAFTSITDNVNTGQYFPLASGMREINHNYGNGIYYHENVAASATTVTLTISPAQTHSRMACAEIKNVPTAYAADTSFVASQALTAANPTTGTTITPYNANEFLYALLVSDGGTNVAGTNYTLLDAQTTTSSTQLVPEYWLQTTATSSNAPYGNAGGFDWSDQMVAFARQQSGTCGLSTLVDWGGGTNGGSPTTTTLYSSTHGNAPQPNSDLSVQRLYGSSHPGVWVVVGTPAVTYATSAYAPLQTTRNCPFYSGSGTTGSGIGLILPTSSTGPNSYNLTFDTTSNKTSVWTCMKTDLSPANSGTIDVFTISRGDNTDYANIQWNSNGATGTWLLEGKTASSSSSTWNWAANTWYGIRLTYNSGGNHSADFYSYSGSACTGSATLMGTLTAASASVGPANTLIVLASNANTYTTGHNFYMGAVELDYLYGSALVP